jgi:hypothetical protein
LDGTGSGTCSYEVVVLAVLCRLYFSWLLQHQSAC